jgi:hypothetical protein
MKDYLYVRCAYHTPAYVGVRVRLADKREGVLTVPGPEHYLRVKLDTGRAVYVHPTDVTYLLEGMPEHTP